MNPTPVNPKDLRIGNWVNLYGKPKQIVPVDLVYLDAVDTDYKDMYEYMPLTPEVLEKGQFKYEHGQVEMYRNGNIWMYFDGECLGANFGHIDRLDVSVKYVHQLQNLTFALSGTELNINL